MRNLKFAFGISLLVSSIVNAGTTTTDGENIRGPSSIEEAEEWQERVETYGTGLPVNAQPTINSRSKYYETY